MFLYKSRNQIIFAQYTYDYKTKNILVNKILQRPIFFDFGDIANPILEFFAKIDSRYSIRAYGVRRKAGCITHRARNRKIEIVNKNKN